MPNFGGQPLGSVTLALRDAGLRLGSITVTAAADQSGGTPSARTPGIEPAQAVPSASPASIIVTQTPAAGQKVMAGSTVDFEVKP